jgi:hypothetical protein
MNTPIATWLPLPAELESMSRVRAAIQYRKLDHRLANGERVQPTLRVVLGIVDMAQRHGMRMPVAISEGSYHLRADIEAEQKLRAERFAHFCKMDGHDGTREERDTCNICKDEGALGTMYYAPDGMAYPAPVIFECYTCRPKK